MLVEDVMTPKEQLVLVEQLDPIRVALEKMKKHKIKSVIVNKTSSGGAYGLLTFKNVLQAVVAQDGDIDLLQVYDVATIPALSVTRKMQMRFAAKMMVQHSIKRLLVVDDNELYGILTMSDIIGTLLEDI